MMDLPHADVIDVKVASAIITVSDTRTNENDVSGQLIESMLKESGHKVVFYQIVKDEPSEIKSLLDFLGSACDLEVIILNGGTGIAPRDNTYDTIEKLLDKILPGFGEIFRFLSYREIGSRAIASRAVAGVFRGKILFSLPGSVNGVKLAMSQLVIPELVHLVKQVSSGKG